MTPDAATTSAQPDRPASPAPARPCLSVETRVAMICCLTGLIGIVSGFALFILWLEKKDEPSRFLLALGIAAALAYVCEQIRELIAHGECEWRWPPPRWVMTVVMLAFFELFVVAVHAAAELDAAAFDGLKEQILGHYLHTAMPQWWQWLSICLMWALIGGALSLWLSRAIIRKPDPASSSRRVLGTGFLSGGFGGVLIGLAAVLGFILVIRFLSATGLLLFRHADWVAQVDDIISGMDAERTRSLANAADYGSPPSGGGLPYYFVRSSLKLVAWLNHLGGNHPYLAIGLIAGWIVLLFNLHRFDETFRKAVGWITAGVGAALVVIMLTPVFQHSDDFFWVVVSVSIIWFIPGAVLGLAAPLLAKPSEHFHLWGFISWIAAAALFGLTLIRLNRPEFLLPASVGNHYLVIALLTLLCAGSVFVFIRKPDRYWPLLPLCLGCIVFMFGMLWFEQRTFLGVMERMNTVLWTPYKPQERPTAVGPWPLPAAGDYLRRTAPSLTELGKPLDLRLTNPISGPTTAPVSASKLLQDAMSAAQGDLSAAASKPSSASTSVSKPWEQPSSHASNAETAPDLKPESHPAEDEGSDTHAEGPVHSGDDDDAHASRSESHATEHELPKPEDCAVVLELLLAASFGFWTSVGLLAGWSMVRREAAAANGRDHAEAH